MQLGILIRGQDGAREKAHNWKVWYRSRSSNSKHAQTLNEKLRDCNMSEQPKLNPQEVSCPNKRKT